MAQVLVHPRQVAVQTVVLACIPLLPVLQAMLLVPTVWLALMAQALAWLLQRAVQTVVLACIPLLLVLRAMLLV